ncbi:fumarylacetoacetate hydrolase family protein [Falsiroseomonas sp.]|uniref:fumarylacetoacetate hydrolase family protein n=1 Tax=Falsiroseomonas sp. TaxID=2870721 RepID=UPI003F7231FD
MRWIKFTAEGRTAYGILEGDRIAEVAGDPFAGYETTSRRHDLAAVKIEVPLIPRTFYAAGLNYVEHVIEGAKKRGETPNIPTKADIGYRAVNALVAHDENVFIPADAGEKIHYEGEIVAVIGKKAKNLSEAEALSCVMGWTIGNDVSERTWQKNDRTFWRGKNTDTFKPMGPWIDTDFDMEAATTNVRLNGEIRTSFATGHMLFSTAHFISVMTKYLTLWPGDVIWLGTDGVSPDLKHGDVVDIEITGLGNLRNTFVREGM